MQTNITNNKAAPGRTASTSRADYNVIVKFVVKHSVILDSMMLVVVLIDAFMIGRAL